MQDDLALPPLDDEWKHLTGENVPGPAKLEEEVDDISAHWPVTMPLNRTSTHYCRASGRRCGIGSAR